MIKDSINDAASLDRIVPRMGKITIHQAHQSLMLVGRIAVDDCKNGELVLNRLVANPTRFTLVCVAGNATIEPRLAAKSRRGLLPIRFFLQGWGARELVLEQSLRHLALQ